LPQGYKLDHLIEGELLLKLVAPNPDNRPTLLEIKLWI